MFVPAKAKDFLVAGNPVPQLEVLVIVADFTTHKPLTTQRVVVLRAER